MATFPVWLPIAGPDVVYELLAPLMLKVNVVPRHASPLFGLTATFSGAVVPVVKVLTRLHCVRRVEPLYASQIMVWFPAQTRTVPLRPIWFGIRVGVQPVDSTVHE
jgi:hypothetical protein